MVFLKTVPPDAVVKNTKRSGQPAGVSTAMEAGYVFWCLTGMKKSKLVFMTGSKNGERAALQVL